MTGCFACVGEFANRPSGLGSRGRNDHDFLSQSEKTGNFGHLHLLRQSAAVGTIWKFPVLWIAPLGNKSG